MFRKIFFTFSLALLLGALLISSGCGKSDTGNQGDGNGSQGGDQATTDTAQTESAANQVQAGDITIIDTRTDQADRTRAKQNVEDTLIRYPDINCLVGLWSYNGPAILSAVKDAGKEGQLPIVAFDEEPDTLQGVADGHIQATVVQQPYEFGYQSVRVLAALARGDQSVVPAGGVLDIPVQVIRKDNVGAFWQTLKDRLAGNVDAATTGTQAGEPVQIAFVTNNTSDFWNIAKAGVAKAEKEFNAKCEFLMPADGTPAEQARLVEALIARGIKGMAISPCDPANQVEMINRVAEVMPVVTQDSDAPNSNRICYIGTNNVKAGREAGKLIREALPQGGKIMIFVGRIDQQNAIERRQGIIDELSGK